MSTPIWLGVGGAKPQPRVLKSSLFGHVVDAFDEKTIVKIGEVSPYEKRMKAKEEAEKQQKLEEALEAKLQNSTEEDKHDKETLVQNSDEPSESVNIGEVKKSFAIDDAVHKIDANPAKPCILIKGGKIVNDDYSFIGDVLIEDEKIVKIEKNMEAPHNDTVCINADGKLLLPGVIDMNVYLESSNPITSLHSIDDFTNGTKAAIHGGTSLIVQEIVPNENQSYLELFENWVTKYGSSLWCDYVVRIGLTRWLEGDKKDIEVLVQEKGVTLFSLPPTTSYDDETILSIFNHLKELGCVVFVSPYNQDLVQMKCNELINEGITGPEGWWWACPEEIELQSIHRYVSLADQVGVPLFITSVTNKIAAQLVAKKRSEGKMVFSSLNIASLVCDGTKIFDSDWIVAANHVTLPPIRAMKINKEALLDYLINNDIQVVTSGHRSFSTEQKAAGKDDFRLIPQGVAAVQEMVQAFWGTAVASGRMDVNRFVSLTSSFPAKLLNLYPTKGRIDVGSNSDIIIIDPSKDHEFNKDNRITQSDFNIFEGLNVYGKIEEVIKSGVLVTSHQTEGSKVVESSTNKGTFIKCSPFPGVAYGRSLFKHHQHGSTNHHEAVKREAYDGPITGQGDDKNKTPSHAAGQRSDHFCRPPTKSGGRNMQDTTLSISVEGTFADDPIKCQKLGGYRVNQPPGGRTNQFW